MEQERISTAEYRRRLGLPPPGQHYENQTHPELHRPKPQRDQKKPLGKADEGKAGILPRVTVRFIGYRVRPLDPDNFAGGCKDLLDGLRHAGLIEGDEPWRIRLETEQVKVSHYFDEKTVIEIETPAPGQP